MTVFLLIWDLAMLTLPLYSQIKNVALVHSCLEIPILKFLRCTRSNQMNKHIFSEFPQATEDCSQCEQKHSCLRFIKPTSSTEEADTYDQFWKCRLKSHQSTDTDCTICAGCVIWHVWIKMFHVFWYLAMTLLSFLITFCSLQCNGNTPLSVNNFYIW